MKLIIQHSYIYVINIFVLNFYNYFIIFFLTEFTIKLLEIDFYITLIYFNYNLI
jgi:hypothetical protein